MMAELHCLCSQGFSAPGCKGSVHLSLGAGLSDMFASCGLYYVHREHFSPILYLENFCVLKLGYCALFGLSSPIHLSFSIGPAF